MMVITMIKDGLQRINKAIIIIMHTFFLFKSPETSRLTCLFIYLFITQGWEDKNAQKATEWKKTATKNNKNKWTYSLIEILKQYSTQFKLINMQTIMYLIVCMLSVLLLNYQHIWNKICFTAKQ